MPHNDSFVFPLTSIHFHQNKNWNVYLVNLLLFSHHALVSSNVHFKRRMQKLGDILHWLNKERTFYSWPVKNIFLITITSSFSFFVHFFHICLVWIALEGTSSWTWHLVSICKSKSEVCLWKKEHLTYQAAFFSDTLQVRAEIAVNNHNKLHPETSAENIQQCPFLLGFFLLLVFCVFLVVVVTVLGVVFLPLLLKRKWQFFDTFKVYLYVFPLTKAFFNILFVIISFFPP